MYSQQLNRSSSENRHSLFPKEESILFSDNQQERTYSSAIGLRFGFEGGITYKTFIGEQSALEFILSTGWGYGGIRLTGLYEMQHQAFDGMEQIPGEVQLLVLTA
ncbi:MAG: hypothetical protein H0X62_11640 [Bacteroidetes bacterium]|nr:hypothetical protein [Bacteroidota bacterium]